MYSFPIGTNGRQLPAIGLGTFQPDAAPPDVVKQAVLDALNEGYRLIDTAFMYGNGVVERAVGHAIKEWGGPREDIWVTSKLANAHHRPRDVGPAVDITLRNLGLEYIDLYLMHYPVAYKTTGDGDLEKRAAARHPDGKPVLDVELTLDYASTWDAMENAVAEGKVREIGVSNFSILKLRKLLETAKIVPAVNQVEMHPYLAQPEMLQFCKSRGIHVQAHSPLGGRPVAQVALNSHIAGPVQDEVIRAIAAEHIVSPAVVLLVWALKRGTSVVPKSYSIGHIRENLKALDNETLELSALEVDQIDNAVRRRASGEERVRFMDTRNHFWFDIFNEVEEEYPRSS